MILWLSIYWEWNNHPNWLIYIFQRGRSTTNQTLCNFYCFKCNFNGNPQFNTTLNGIPELSEKPVECSVKNEAPELPRFSFVRRVWTYLLNPFSPSFSHLLVIKIAMWIYFLGVYLIFRQIHSTTFQFSMLVSRSLVSLTNTSFNESQNGH